ncbi:hydrogenase nickel incorporation protein HypB [Pontiella sp.]|uniref:hydrogenase nickel incorporation protein HypB n=1 Tax=Pontiella sp. TaxID=2837462 RepID=UPI00356406D7
MCETCGCGTANEHHHHDHEHRHTKTVSLEQKVLARNDELADKNRAWLAERGVVAINLISSPGSGKTFLLEKTLEALDGKIKCGVITGDQQTDRDAQRLQGKGAKIRQVETISSCHLDAHQVWHALADVVDDDTQLLFIENVGNLVCPTAFDLGESFKVALLSTPEGEDKPVKYPVLFATAKAVVLTKMDLAEALDWDLAACRKYIQQVQPGANVIELSAKSGQGMDDWLNYLRRLVS